MGFKTFVLGKQERCFLTQVLPSIFPYSNINYLPACPSEVFPISKGNFFHLNSSGKSTLPCGPPAVKQVLGQLVTVPTAAALILSIRLTMQNRKKTCYEWNSCRGKPGQYRSAEKQQQRSQEEGPGRWEPRLGGRRGSQPRRGRREGTGGCLNGIWPPFLGCLHAFQLISRTRRATGCVGGRFS